jgi:hypothetical protein
LAIQLFASGRAEYYYYTTADVRNVITKRTHHKLSPALAWISSTSASVANIWVLNHESGAL